MIIFDKMIYFNFQTQCLISRTTPLVITPQPINLHFLSILRLNATFSPGEVQTATMSYIFKEFYKIK